MPVQTGAGPGAGPGPGPGPGPLSPLDTGVIPEIKRPRRGVDHPPLLAKVKEE